MKTAKEIMEKLKHLTDDVSYMVKDISHELYREYEHGGQVYRIDQPRVLIMKKGGSTHRIVDAKNVAHCHPIPGNGCALRWFNGENETPVNF